MSFHQRPEHPRPWKTAWAYLKEPRPAEHIDRRIICDAKGQQVCIAETPELAAAIIRAVNIFTYAIAIEREKESTAPPAQTAGEPAGKSPWKVTDTETGWTATREPLAPDEAGRDSFTGTCPTCGQEDMRGPSREELDRVMAHLHEIEATSDKTAERLILCGRAALKLLGIDEQTGTLLEVRRAIEGVYRTTEMLAAGRASLEADQFVPTHFERIPESDDGDTVCDGCGSTMDGDERHTWKECLPLAVENIQNAEGQVNDFLSKENSRLTEERDTALAENAELRREVDEERRKVGMLMQPAPGSTEEDNVWKQLQHWRANRDAEKHAERRKLNEAVAARDAAVADMQVHLDAANAIARSRLEKLLENSERITELERQVSATEAVVGAAKAFRSAPHYEAMDRLHDLGDALDALHSPGRGKEIDG